MATGLEREILTFALGSPSELRRLKGSELEELPTIENANDYGRRFENCGLWHGILGIVRRQLGPLIRRELQLAPNVTFTEASTGAVTNSAQLAKACAVIIFKEKGVRDGVNAADSAAAKERLESILQTSISDWLAGETRASSELVGSESAY
ncbi:hypothetical protein V8C42DRAFT_337809 [Trichoderma barbatum]